MTKRMLRVFSYTKNIYGHLSRKKKQIFQSHKLKKFFVHRYFRPYLFRPLKMWRDFVFRRVLVFFSTQNQAPQIYIGLGWVIYHIKAPLVGSRKTSKNFSKFFSGLEKN